MEPKFNQVSKLMMETYGIKFVHWENDRGGGLPIVKKIYLGHKFWSMTIDDMCNNIKEIVNASTLISDNDQHLQGKSCHFNDNWGYGQGFCYILGGDEVLIKSAKKR